MGNQDSTCCPFPSKTNNHQVQPLQNIIRSKDINKLIAYLKEEGDNFAYQQISDKKTGNTLLHDIMRREDLTMDLCQYLLILKNIDWTICNYHNQTPIHLIYSQTIKQRVKAQALQEQVCENENENKNLDVSDNDPLADIHSDKPQQNQMGRIDKYYYDNVNAKQNGRPVQPVSPLMIKKTVSILETEQIAQNPQTRFTKFKLKKVPHSNENDNTNFPPCVPQDEKEDDEEQFHKIDNEMLVSRGDSQQFQDLLLSTVHK